MLKLASTIINIKDVLGISAGLVLKVSSFTPASLYLAINPELVYAISPQDSYVLQVAVC